MSTDILDQLTAAAAPLLAARAEIERLTADIEQHAAELAAARQQLADLVHGTGDGVPALPRQGKFVGTAYNTDGECMTRTDTELEAHGKHCYARGLSDGRRAERTALGIPPNYGPSQAEQDHFAAQRRGESVRKA